MAGIAGAKPLIGLDPAGGSECGGGGEGRLYRL